jgi:hypothetical protein
MFRYALMNDSDAMRSTSVSYRRTDEGTFRSLFLSRFIQQFCSTQEDIRRTVTKRKTNSHEFLVVRHTVKAEES